MPKVGAHVSAAGSLVSSFNRALEIGAECTQIFITPPSAWAKSNHSEEGIEEYRSKAAQTGIGPNFIHSVYLINLASVNPVNLERSINWLIYSQKMAERLGMAGTIFHVGSYKDTTYQAAIKQVAEAINKILAATGHVDLILENSAGAGNLIGDKFIELGEIIKAVDDPRLKVCLDTQHAFASGYNLTTPQGLDGLVREFDEKIGLERLVAIHANDSKTELGSNRDRHANLGEGLIGLEGFRGIINHPAFQDIPFIMEVPGFAGKGSDKENIVLMKKLID